MSGETRSQGLSLIVQFECWNTKLWMNCTRPQASVFGAGNKMVNEFHFVLSFGDFQ